jgi:hypothetical protein
MTQCILESCSTVDLSVITNMGNLLPPRDPNDKDDGEDEDGDTEPDDDCQPAVIREPDEGE